MQLLGLLLILLNIGAIAAPVAGVVMMNTNDLSQVIIPSDIEDIISNNIDNEESIELLQYVCSSFDATTRTAKVTFSFTNPFEFDLVLSQVSAKIKCLDHGVKLGYAKLIEQVEINQKETKEINVKFVWTKEAENHFIDKHKNETVVDIKLVDMDLDISGINIEIPEEVILSLPIISEEKN
jgi:hypothetical protein